jgi:hypothetical protein
MVDRFVQFLFGIDSKNVPRGKQVLVRRNRRNKWEPHLT